MAGVMMAQAQDLKVAGKSVSSSGTVSGAGQSSGTISYNSSSNILTFDGVVINYTGDRFIDWTGTSELTIRFKGYNKLDVSKYGIYSQNSDIKIDGGIDEGAWLNFTTTGDSYAVATVKGGHTMKIRNILMEAKGVRYCFTGDNTDIPNSKIDFMTCEVTATVTDGSSSIGAVARFGSAEFDSTDAILTTGSFNSSMHAICDGSTPLNTVKIETPMKMGYLPVGQGYSAVRTLTPSGMNGSGTIKYDYSNKTLTLDGINYTSYERFLDSKVEGLKVVVKGTNTINCGNTWGIFSFKSFSIEGYSSTYSSNKLTMNNAFGAICLWISENGNATMSLKNLTLDLAGSSSAISGQRNSGITGDLALNINNCKIKAVYTGSETYHGSIYGFKSSELVDTDVKTAYCCFRNSLNGFGTLAGLSNTVEMEVPATKYKVWVLGHQVTSVNPEQFGLDGYSGWVKYYPSEKKLTFDGVKLNAPEGNTSGGVKAEDGAVEKITLEGTNEVTTKGNAFQLYGEVTFEGTGSLTATSTESSGVSMYAHNNNGSVTINVNNKVKFFGKKRGAWGDHSSSNISNLVLKKAGSSSDYYFQGNDYGAVENFTDLQLTNMDFWSGSDGTPGCYFDNLDVLQNGGSRVKGDNVVNFYRLNDGDSYGLLVGGVEVTSCNMYGIGSKFITAGGGKAVVYDNSSKTLTLNGAKIDMSSSSEAANCIYNSKDSSSGSITGPGVDNLIIDVTGDCELRSFAGSTTWSSMNLWRNTTIKGNGNLKLSGNYGDIYANKGAVVTLNDINMEMAGTLFGSGDSEKLHINLTTAGKKVSVANGVYSWGTIYLDNGTKIAEPEGAKLSDDYTKVVTASGSIAKDVVFADKNATGIEGVLMNADAEIQNIYDAEGRQIDEMQQGVNIVRMSDGTTRKVIKK